MKANNTFSVGNKLILAISLYNDVKSIVMKLKYDEIIKLFVRFTIKFS